MDRPGIDSQRVPIYYNFSKCPERDAHHHFLFEIFEEDEKKINCHK